MHLTYARNHARFLLFFCICLGWATEQQSAAPIAIALAAKGAVAVKTAVVAKAVALKAALAKFSIAGSAKAIAASKASAAGVAKVAAAKATVTAAATQTAVTVAPVAVTTAVTVSSTATVARTALSAISTAAEVLVTATKTIVPEGAIAAAKKVINETTIDCIKHSEKRQTEGKKVPESPKSGDGSSRTSGDSKWSPDDNNGRDEKKKTRPDGNNQDGWDPVEEPQSLVGLGVRGVVVGAGGKAVHDKMSSLLNKDNDNEEDNASSVRESGLEAKSFAPTGHEGTSSTGRGSLNKDEYRGYKEQIGGNQNQPQAPPAQRAALVMTPSGPVQIRVPSAVHNSHNKDHHDHKQGSNQLAFVMHSSGAIDPTIATGILGAATDLINAAGPQAAKVVVPVVVVGTAGALTAAAIKHGPKSVYQVVSDFVSGPNTHTKFYKHQKEFVEQQEDFIRQNPDAVYQTILEQHKNRALVEVTRLVSLSDSSVCMDIDYVPVSASKYNGNAPVGQEIATSHERPLIHGFDHPAAFRAQAEAEASAASAAQARVKVPCIGSEVVIPPPTGCGQPAAPPEKQNPGCNGSPIPLPTHTTLPAVEQAPITKPGCSGKQEPTEKGEGCILSVANNAQKQSSDVPAKPKSETPKQPVVHNSYDSSSEVSIRGAVVDQILADAAAISVNQETGMQQISQPVEFIDKESGWCMPENGGAIIGGRKYSTHALERMAPDTIQVRAELIRRALSRGYKPTLTDGKINKKFLEQIDPRGIPPMVVEGIIQSTIPIAGKEEHSETLNYIADGIKIAVNKNGDVVTVHRYSKGKE